jgi:hypothetical protein
VQVRIIKNKSIKSSFFSYINRTITCGPGYSFDGTINGATSTTIFGTNNPFTCQGMLIRIIKKNEYYHYCKLHDNQVFKNYKFSLVFT